MERESPRDLTQCTPSSAPLWCWLGFKWGSAACRRAPLFSRTETVVLVDQQRHIRGVYNGTLAFDMRRLIEDVRTLQGSGTK